MLIKNRNPSAHTGTHVGLIGVCIGSAGIDVESVGVRVRSSRVFLILKTLLYYASFYWRLFFFLAFFCFYSRFLIFPRGFLTFLTKNEKHENPTRFKRENIFLFYTTHWVKTRGSCVFFAFFLTFLLANLTKTQSQYNA